MVTLSTRQRNQFLVLMQNMNTALSLQTTEASSAGSAMNRYGVYATSTKARIDDFINTAQKMWTNVFNSSEINGVISAGNSVLNVVSQIINKLGALPTLAASLSGILSLSGKNAGKQYAHLLKVA